MARGVERYELVHDLTEASSLCKQAGGLRWRVI